jgi:hypothetical protein
MTIHDQPGPTWVEDAHLEEGSDPMAAPMFHTIALPARLARCGACGALVDASEDGRRMHVAWHQGGVSPVIDLTALEAAALV